MEMNIETSVQRKRGIGKWFLLICLSLLSVFPIYKNFYYSNGLKTYERQQAVINGNSDFYNPWQYRVLCPFALEGMVWVYNHTIDKIYPIESHYKFSIDYTSGTTQETTEFVTLMQTPGVIKYMLMYVLFRFLENLAIFYLAWRLWRYFVKSDWLIFFGMNFLALALGNAVAISDLAFNTYMDILFYLLTANIIVYKKNAAWLIPLSILAAFNRETGILIPALYFISETDFSRFSFAKMNIKALLLPVKKVWLITIASYIVFFAVFIWLRVHYGYRPQQDWKVAAGWPMLKMNLVSAVAAKGYLELIGTFGVLPLIILYKFKTFPHLLKKWFIFLVPIWFLAHYITVTAYQTRLFLVPIILIFLPMVLWLIERSIQNHGQPANKD